MARYIGMEDDWVYRAVIVCRCKDGGDFTSIQGPYSTRGQAKARITRVQRYYAGSAVYESVAGHVEQSPLTWTRVED